MYESAGRDTLPQLESWIFSALRILRFKSLYMYMYVNSLFFRLIVLSNLILILLTRSFKSTLTNTYSPWSNMNIASESI